MSGPSPELDDYLGRLLVALREALGDRMVSAYLTGSCADGTATPASDVDVTLVCEPGLTPAEHAALYAYLEARLPDPIALDLGVYGLDDLRRRGAPLLAAGRCLHGVDVREGLPDADLTIWTRARMHGAWQFVGRSRCLDAPRPLALPLDWPDPSAPLRGYDFREFTRPDGTTERMTKELVVVSGWVATARLARAGRVIATKSAVPAAYRELDDGWGEFVDEVYTRCRQDWGYLVPTGAADVEALRSICTRMLAFENDFALEYRDWVLDELDHGDATAARRELARSGLLDARVEAALAR